MLLSKFNICCLFFFIACLSARAQSGRVVYRSKAYTVYADSVVQGKNKAVVISPDHIVSDYQSPENQYISPVIDFKFSINGKDNEMTSGHDDHFVCTAADGKNVTPVIKFGHQYADPRPVPAGLHLKPGATLKIRLDMREVLDAFKKQGFYVCFNGDKLYKADFKGVFVAGKPAPLIWDFNNLVNHPDLQLKDPDGDGIYETTLTFGLSDNRTASSWTLNRDISAFPQYRSDYKISDALYNLALAEMQNAIEPDSTFRTGKEWSGVWTRDISYSIILSMAVLQPKVAMYSLMRKVKNDRIIQDTGTGGAYPVSTDRVIWAVAAWEVYKVTGDSQWLEKACRIVKNSVDDDEKNAYDHHNGLVHGESSFLDWREETYPRWMQPADIYQSECLGTNVVHYEVNRVLAAMCRITGEGDAAEYEQHAETIRNAINHNLWMADKGYYGQYLYGRNFSSLSPRSEALGEALAVLFGAASPEQQREIVSRAPVNDFGIPCIYPQIPDILPYHNNAVWPFVESFWAMASARAGNETSLIRAISAVYRPAALFLTDKENFVAANGDYAGTQINSSNMLWSLSGSIGLVYKIFFGMQYHTNALVFKPFVPRALAGDRSLTHYGYRGASLDITMSGFGNRIKSITMDGEQLAGDSVSAELKGEHHIKIVLADNSVGGSSNLAPGYTAPGTPVVKYNRGMLNWPRVPRAVYYRIMKNGKPVAKVKSPGYRIRNTAFAEYQVAAEDAAHVCSFNSEPVAIYPATAVQHIEMEDVAEKSDLPYQGFSGKGFVKISKTENTVLHIRFDVPRSGMYSFDFRYANGNGPINTDNKCAVRTMDIDEAFAGTLVFPQRGKGEWSNWGFSNPVKVELAKGRHILTLKYTSANENMNGAINEAMLDYLRIIHIPANK